MLKRVFMLICLFGCLGILFFTGCTTTDSASDYTLTVTMGSGVSGNPATGSYSYAENDTVSYSYTAQAGYGNLTVTLDGAPVGNSGVVTMTANHTLNATATVDVRGMWSGRFNYLGDDTYFEVTFTGGILSGTTRGLFDFLSGFGNGIYTLSGNEIEFTLRYPTYYYGEDSWLACSGTFSNANSMSGEWYWTDPYWESSGTFTLQR